MVLIVLCSTFDSNQSSEKNTALWTLDSADRSCRQRTNRHRRRNISNKHFNKKDIKLCRLKLIKRSRSMSPREPKEIVVNHVLLMSQFCWLPWNYEIRHVYVKIDSLFSELKSAIPGSGAISSAICSSPSLSIPAPLRKLPAWASNMPLVSLCS